MKSTPRNGKTSEKSTPRKLFKINLNKASGSEKSFDGISINSDVQCKEKSLLFSSFII